jgi:hypothetical protein
VRGAPVCVLGRQARLTGLPVFLHDSNVGTEHDMRSMDTIALPLALAVLAVIIRSLRLLALPLLSLGCSVCFSFSFMYFVVTSGLLPVVSYVPPMLLSLTLAMSVDYSLFILTRYREEVLKRRSAATVQVRGGCALAAPPPPPPPLVVTAARRSHPSPRLRGGPVRVLRMPANVCGVCGGVGEEAHLAFVRNLPATPPPASDCGGGPVVIGPHCGGQRLHAGGLLLWPVRYSVLATAVCGTGVRHCHFVHGAW